MDHKFRFSRMLLFEFLVVFIACTVSTNVL